MKAGGIVPCPVQNGTYCCALEEGHRGDHESISWDRTRIARFKDRWAAVRFFRVKVKS